MPLFVACMNARGWSLESESQIKGTGRALVQRQEKNCADQRFAPYYIKTACMADKITAEQLADRSTISSEAKAIFLELRSQIDAENIEFFDFQRHYGGAAGAKRANLYMNTAKVQNDKNNLDLYNGLITWGEYNRRRQEIFRQYDAEAKRIAS